ncbi:hypothetical protein CK203_113509 [Vitis vinifera]|uniref:Retrovirus-related Pol polyprotein from transposon RE1 n=1 Tax=Vitis vinifera TaxID=29760 RepID=A0A438FH21_VITVI|nr:hypothetical protein CK203_113509 [Vitis vinifera]
MTFLSLNVGNFITLKHSPTNYPLWHEQAFTLAESQELLSHLTNEDPVPPQYNIPDSSNTPTTETQQVTYLRKEDDKTIGEHIRTFKSLCDSLAVIGKPVPDKEKVFCLLTSLGPQYETFTTTMLKPLRPSYSELVSQLQSLDQRRNWFSNHANATMHSLLKWPSTDSNNKDIHNPPQDIKATNKHSLQQEEDSRHNNQRTKTMATPLAQHPVLNKDNPPPPPTWRATYDTC